MPSKKTPSNSSTPARRRQISCTSPREDHKDPQGNFGERKLPDNTTSEPVSCRTDVHKTYEVSGGNTTCSKFSENLIHALTYTTDGKTADDDYLKRIMDDFQVVYPGTYGNGSRWMQYYRENRGSYMARIKKSRKDGSLGTDTQIGRADRRIGDTHPVRSTLFSDNTAEQDRPAILWPRDLLPETLHPSGDEGIDPMSYTHMAFTHIANGPNTQSFTRPAFPGSNSDPIFCTSHNDIERNIVFENQGYQDHVIFSEQMISILPSQDYLQNMNGHPAHPLSMYDPMHPGDTGMPMIIGDSDVNQTLASHGNIGVSSRNPYSLPTTWDGQCSQVSRGGEGNNHIYQG
ncbi:uncharacterized protein L199_001653 [Kwoniella botswanensis]|uniref:uncharacterized protein n=1 Tax=Kwoniella botswanensis TaxID=1268659 RepID=UPI00315DC694